MVLSKALSVSAIFVGILCIGFGMLYNVCFIFGVILILAGIFDYFRADKQEKKELRSTKPDRHCPNCGRGIPFDAKRCPYCKKDFEEF